MSGFGTGWAVLGVALVEFGLGWCWHLCPLGLFSGRAVVLSRPGLAAVCGWHLFGFSGRSEVQLLCGLCQYSAAGLDWLPPGLDASWHCWNTPLCALCRCWVAGRWVVWTSGLRWPAWGHVLARFLLGLGC